MNLKCKTSCQNYDVYLFKESKKICYKIGAFSTDGISHDKRSCTITKIGNEKVEAVLEILLYTTMTSSLGDYPIKHYEVTLRESEMSFTKLFYMFSGKKNILLEISLNKKKRYLTKVTSENLDINIAKMMISYIEFNNGRNAESLKDQNLYQYYEDKVSLVRILTNISSEVKKKLD